MKSTRPRMLNVEDGGKNAESSFNVAAQAIDESAGSGRPGLTVDG